MVYVIPDPESRPLIRLSSALLGLPRFVWQVTIRGSRQDGEVHVTPIIATLTDKRNYLHTALPTRENCVINRKIFVNNMLRFTI
jgi:hypothetical protein